MLTGSKRFRYLRAGILAFSISSISILLANPTFAATSLSEDDELYSQEFQTSDSINGTTEIRVSDNVSALLGKVGFNFNPQHHMYLIGQKSSKEGRATADTYAIGYRWNIFSNQALSLRSTNSDLTGGKTRSNYRIGYSVSLPSTSFVSSLFVTYKENRDVNSIAELRYSIRKNFPLATKSIRFTADLKWRQRETTKGVIVKGTGGSIGSRLKISPKYSLQLDHPIGDDISNPITSVFANYSTKLRKNPLLVKLGTNSNQVTYLTFKMLVN